MKQVAKTHQDRLKDSYIRRGTEHFKRNKNAERVFRDPPAYGRVKHDSENNSSAAGD